MVDLGTPVLTHEEELLADLLASNEQLLEVLEQYNDLKRVALEREAEDRSWREVRMDPRQPQYITEDGTLHGDALLHSLQHLQLEPAYQTALPHPQAQAQQPVQLQQQTLPPPLAAPHGPRSPLISGRRVSLEAGTPRRSP
jgi:hypothetical protein